MREKLSEDGEIIRNKSLILRRNVTQFRALDIML